MRPHDLPERPSLCFRLQRESAVRLPHSAPAYSLRKAKQRHYDFAKAHTPRRRLHFPFLALRRDRHKETPQRAVKQQNSINARPLRTRSWRSRPTAE